jgi:hypothetical protein
MSVKVGYKLLQADRHISISFIQGAYKLSEDFANHIFTNTEQKYMMLLPFERGMFAVS